MTEIGWPVRVIRLRSKKNQQFILSWCLLFSVSEVIAAKDSKVTSDGISEEKSTVTEARSPARISILGGYHIAQGNLKDILPSGVDARLAFELPLGREAWPLLRLELGYTGFGALPGKSSYSVTGTAWAAGPVWILRPIKSHHGQFISGFLIGVLSARLQGPGMDEHAHLFATTVLLGYEYPIGSILLYGQARGGYIADQNNPVMSVGGVLGVARPLFDG